MRKQLCFPAQRKGLPLKVLWENGCTMAPSPAIQFFVAANANAGYGHSYDDTWTRISTEDIQIGNRHIKAIIFERALRARTNPYHGKFKLWFDPETNLWVKNVYTHIDGSFPRVANTELTKVIVP